MTLILARPWWLGALALLIPLLVLHLRRPALRVREVPSLLVWERVTGTAPSDTRRLRRPRHPLLLALQALVLGALVVALAGPSLRSGSPHAETVYVVDGSFWMRAGTRLAVARDDLTRMASDRPGDVALVSAGPTPAIVYEGARSGLAGHLDELRAVAATGDLGAAIGLGAGLLGGSAGRMVVLRAPETPMPAVAAAPGQLHTTIVGTPADDQAILSPQARCGIGPDDACEVLATLRNGAPEARVDRYTASVPGQRTVHFRTRVPARSSATIALTAQPGSTLRLSLQGRDALRADDAASVVVPGTDDAPPAATVTLVGDPVTALPLAQAFSSVPGVTLLLRTTRTYRPKDARASELVVLDDWLPASGLPATPAVVLIDPPRLPGGSIRGAIAAPTVSAVDAGSPLVAGVDLASLNIDRGAAQSLALPSWMQAVISSPDGPLLAAGDDGRQRVAVLAFDPPRSNLGQLAALPILARNLVGWADDWTSIGDDGSLSVDALPGATTAHVGDATGTVRARSLAGGPAGITDLAAGTTEVAVTGGGDSHRRTLVRALASPRALADAAPSTPSSLLAWAATPSRHDRDALAPWLIALALVAMGAEWAVWRRIHR